VGLTTRVAGVGVVDVELRTVTDAVPDFSSVLAVIVTEPADFAVTTPPDVTDAIVVDELDQMNDFPAIGFPY
jgi:hypothetical protein